MSDNHVEGVSYFRIEGFAPEMFRCQTWRANLAVPSCAARWRKAQKARGEDAVIEWRLCASCPIGAAHAGEPQMPRAANFGTNVCCRCRRGTLRRMIGQRHCISCWNREAEWRKGRNARGNAPIKALAELRYLTLAVVLDPGQPGERTVEYTDIAIDEEELRLTIGRVHEGHIELLGLVPHGTYQAWRPAALGGLKAIITPPAEANSAPGPAPDPEVLGKRGTAAIGRLRRAALGTSCMSGLRVVAAPERARMALMSGSLQLAA